MDRIEEFIENAVCELHMTVGEDTKIKWDGNGPGRFMAVLTLVETLAKMQGVSFETLIAYLYQAHEAIEQEEVADGQVH
ncbi:MAG: hypothetical protein II506_07840 [Lachnospiraceae bacterium]|nr:hypothetical protein [Lachnospiraceae bacterium]